MTKIWNMAQLRSSTYRPRRPLKPVGVAHNSQIRMNGVPITIGGLHEEVCERCKYHHCSKACVDLGIAQLFGKRADIGAVIALETRLAGIIETIEVRFPELRCKFRRDDIEAYPYVPERIVDTLMPITYADANYLIAIARSVHSETGYRMRLTVRERKLVKCPIDPADLQRAIADRRTKEQLQLVRESVQDVVPWVDVVFEDCDDKLNLHGMVHESLRQLGEALTPRERSYLERARDQMIRDYGIVPRFQPKKRPKTTVAPVDITFGVEYSYSNKWPKPVDAASARADDNGDSDDDSDQDSARYGDADARNQHDSNQLAGVHVEGFFVDDCSATAGAALVASPQPREQWPHAGRLYVRQMISALFSGVPNLGLSARLTPPGFVYRVEDEDTDLSTLKDSVSAVMFGMLSYTRATVHAQTSRLLNYHDAKACRLPTTLAECESALATLRMTARTHIQKAKPDALLHDFPETNYAGSSITIDQQADFERVRAHVFYRFGDIITIEPSPALTYA